jgi:hypothetical protein
MNSLKKDARRLKSVPPEYRASVYAKMEQEKRSQQDAKSRESLASLRSTLKELKEELRKACTESAQVDLISKISACEKAIKKSPKPTRKWSPTLPGSFESGQKR